MNKTTNSKFKTRIICFFWIAFVLFLMTFWWVISILETTSKRKYKIKSYSENVNLSYKDLSRELKSTILDFKYGEIKWR